jgi:3-isopropylmalate/(R)-2-methylmalate dehydratase small subunit
MRKLSEIVSLAMPLLESDIDTDAIFPARFLLLLSRKGIGKHLFHERRQRPAGAAPFILDDPKYEGAEILVAGPRFGVGSSREHAVWALADFGIRCIIAPSFGDIFFANCLKNGILPIRLDGEAHAALVQAAKAAQTVHIDLPEQTVTPEGGAPLGFEIAPRHKHGLLNGLDEIGSILAEDGDAIAAFEARHAAEAPWLALSDAQLVSFVGPSRSHSQ